MKTEPAAFRPRHLSLTACPACATRKVTHKSDYPSEVKPFAACTVLYCTHCGLGFVPRAGRLLERYYQQDYAAKNRGDRSAKPEIYFSEAHRSGSKKLYRYFTRAKHQVALLKKHGTTFGDVLDFGSGPGYFLHVSKAARKFAYDPDPESRKYLDFLEATQYAAPDEIPEGHFSAIAASHTIEHLPAEELIPTLRLLLRGLQAKGRLLIEVPNGGHTYLRLKGARQDPHTLFFTPQALVEAVRIAGAKVIFQGAVGKPPIPLRKDALYQPHPDHPFFSAAHGGLTVICTRSKS